MNKKGFTVVELIVSVTLTFIIVSLLFQVLLTLRDVYVSSGIRTQLLNKQALMSAKINDDIYNKDLVSVVKCGRNCLNFIYNDNTNARLVVDVTNDIFKYGDYTTELVTGSRFEDVDIRVEQISGINPGANDSMLILKIPVMHPFFEKNYGLNIVYPFDSSTSSISDVVFDGYNDQDSAILLKGSSEMRVSNFEEPGWFTIVGDSDLVNNDSRVQVSGSVNNNVEGTYVLTYELVIDSNIVATATRTVEIVSFVQTFVNCGDIYTDERDNKTYKTVQIGDQCWFQENLKYSQSGCMGRDWTTGDPDACEEHEANHGQEILYQWLAAMDGNPTEGSSGICPDGWYLPSDNDWKELEITLGLTQAQADSTGSRGTDQGQQLKSVSPSWGGTNTVGFNAMPSGRRSTLGEVHGVNTDGYWWSSSPSITLAWNRHLTSSLPAINRDVSNQYGGFSIRCLLDQ